MATVIDISYFNTFLLKQVSNSSEAPVWPNGYPYNQYIPITSFSAGVVGTGYSVASNVATSTAGAGIGLTVDILEVVSGAISEVKIHTVGSGYLTDDVVTILGGDENATLLLTVDSFPGTVNNNAINQWVIEESRIRGGYNNTQVDLGAKAYLVEPNPSQEHRFNSLIYSGVFNSRTGINNSNQFSIGEDITKSADPANGSIQKLFAEDTNLIVLQENKVSRAPIDKNIIYSAEGGGSLTASNSVIGTIQAYAGNYGISKNPESFASYGYQKYFSDKYRNVVLRLSQDGLTEISSYGMTDFFRDQLVNLPESSLLLVSVTASTTQSNVTKINVTGSTVDIQTGMRLNINNFAFTNTVRSVVGQEITISNPPVSVNANDSISFEAPYKGKIIGGYDIHNKNYTLSMQPSPTWALPNSDYYTLSFDELVNGWVSFYTYKPTFITSLKSKYYSFKDNDIWEHYVAGDNNQNACRFYGFYSPSKIKFVFNQDPGMSKNFQTVNYEGDNGWQIDSFISDVQGADIGNTFGVWKNTNDVIAQIPSYLGGSYDNYGRSYPSILIPPINYAGFVRKENKYYANLINNSSPTNGEVIWGLSVSGIKGRYATVTVSTDSITQVGGKKELWAVGATYTNSSY
jgi:hypothetical protein